MHRRRRNIGSATGRLNPAQGPVEPLEKRLLLAATLTALKAAPGSVNEMVLLGNGDVMAQLGGGAGWALLTPSSTGSYINGTWTRLSTSHDTRTYYSTQVLQNGSVFVAGGEYGTGGAKGEVYNPSTNTWTPIPTGVGSYIDAGSEILNDGDVLEAPVYPASSGYTYLYHPSTNTWSTGAKLYRGSDADEQNWVKLADGSILSPDGAYTSERYIPATNTWVNDATSTIKFNDSLGEFGVGALLPNGKVIYFGTGSTTEIYTPSGTASPGSWSAGPTLPAGIGQDDAPAAVLPDGNVLFCVGPIDSYSGPTTFDVYNYLTNTISSATPVPTVTGPAYINRFLDLPNGTTLISSTSNAVYDYSDGGTALTAPTPTITSIVHNTDGSYLLTGTQLNGNSEGAYYGDDAQMSSNYPIVRLTSSTGTVYFATTYNWSSDGVQTGSTPVTTNFKLPAGLPAGTYTLNVMVNGFISANATLTTPYITGDLAPTVATAAAANPSPATALTTSLSVLGADADDGESNLTYTWANTSAPSGGSTASLSANGTNAAKNVTATFQQAGTYTFVCTITDPSGLSVQSSVTVVVKQTLTSVTITPTPTQLTAGQTQQLAATAYDQFGNAMTTTPVFTWALASGGGTVSSTGLYTSPSTGTLAKVTASTGGVTATDSVYVVSAPWTSADIGSPGVAGTAYDSSGTFTVTGSGLDVSGTADHFQYVYQPLGGDGEITARVVSESPYTSTSEKAGVMIRNTLDTSAQEADMLITPGNLAEFQSRVTAAGSTTAVSSSGKAAPYWVRLVRSGNTFTGYYSANGTTWTKESSVTIGMGSSTYVGLFVTSQSDTAAATVTFDNVSLLDAAPDTLTVSPGVPAMVNVLTNDVGPSGATLTVTAVSTPTKGTVTFTAAGNVTYTSNANATGPDTFTYTVSDGLGDTATATVTVSILGLQAYYKMNEGTGTTTADATGNGFTATIAGATWSTGVDGSNGLAFSGTSQYVTAPVLNLNSNTVTLSGWIDRTAAEPTSAGIIFERDSGGGFGLDFYNTTTLGYTWGTSASTYNFNSGLVPALNTWTFVALVVTGSNATIYMEPQGGTMKSATQTISLPAGSFSSITGIGEDPSYTTRDFAGSMDEVRIYNTALTATGIAALANLNPTIATAAAASPSPVTGTSTNLSVLGADYNGESALTYTWAATTTPNGASTPTFSVNGSNAAKSTVATFTKAGTYTFTVTIADAAGLSVTSAVSVTVTLTATTVVVTPSSASLGSNGTQQFSAVAYDQFGVALASQPTFTWSNSGVGSVNSTGLYTAPTNAGSATVTATAGSISGSATVAVASTAPTVATAAAASPSTVTGTTVNLSVLGASAAGESTLTYTWAITAGPTSVAYSANGTNGAKSTVATFAAAGSYSFTVTITDTAGRTVTSGVNVTVVATLTTVSLSTPSVAPGGTTQAAAADQFGNAVAVTWSATGGTITTAGLYTAGSTAGSFPVTATAGTTVVHATVTVAPNTFAGTAGNDTYAIRLSPTNAAVEQIFVNTPETGTPTYALPWVQLNTLTFTPASDGSVTVDFAYGNPIPAGGISYSGGNGLYVEGVATGGLAFTVNASQAVYAGATGSPIAYSGLQAIEFDLAGGSNTLTQSAQPGASLVYDAGAGANTLNVSGGTYTVNGDPALSSGSLTVNDAASLVISAPAANTGYTTRNLAALNLTGTATATITSSTTATDRTVLETAALSVAAGATLDIGNNAMIVHNGDATAIGKLVASGYNAGHGFWTGTGIVSSAARVDPTGLTAVGYFSNNAGNGASYQSTFDNQPVVATDVLMKHTYVGDTNLDGTVNIADYTRLDAGYLAGSTGWFNGDFNYDGAVDGSDYTLADNAFNTLTGQLPTGTPSNPTPTDPNPTPPVPVVPTPTAEYTFDAGTAVDVTGNGYDGTVHNAVPTTGIDTTLGLAFTGKSSVSLPPLDLDSSAVTLSGWILRDGTQTNATGLIFNRTAAGGSGLTMDGGDVLGYRWGPTAGSTFNSGLVVPDGVWTFVALVVTPINATLYMQPDGSAMSSSTHNQANPYVPFTGTTTIGADPLGNKGFKGSMDEVRVYASALTASDVAALADRGPVVTVAASATPSETAGGTAALLVGAVSPDGSANLTYTWAASAEPAGAQVSFGLNGTTQSYSTTVTTTLAGVYTFTVTITDPQHRIATSSTTISFDSNPYDAGAQLFAAAPVGQGVTPLDMGNFTADSLTPDQFEDNDSPADRWVLEFDSLTIVGPDSQVDLGDNDAIIHSATPALADQTLAQITGYIRSGYGLGGASNWTYGGLVSSLAAADPTMALGVMLNRNAQGKPIYTTFDGVPVTATDVLVKYTKFGDANLDGTVNAADAALLAAGEASHATGWYHGDFNYDGTVDSADAAIFNAAKSSATAASQVVTLAAPAALFSSTLIGR
jgi:regulation of enolase protein 1 (concanavalin A-like superfamily)